MEDRSRVTDAAAETWHKTDLHAWVSPTPEERALLRARARELLAKSREASNTRVWNSQYIAVGVLAEWAFAEVAGLQQPTSVEIRDGGHDYRGLDLDVKGAHRWRAPRLLRLASDPLKASSYALVAVDLDLVRARYVGWATRAMLADAPHVEYGYGPTRTLLADELLAGLPFVYPPTL